MATREIRMLCGIPGVGKSTYAKRAVDKLKQEGHTAILISRDLLRFTKIEERGGDYFDYENEVFEDFICIINNALYLGVEYIFIDATNISFKSRMKVLRRLVFDEQPTIIFEVFDFDLATALQRNENRTGLAHVPPSAIQSMWKNFKSPNNYEIVQIKEKLHLTNQFRIIQHTKDEKYE